MAKMKHHFWYGMLMAKSPMLELQTFPQNLMRELMPGGSQEAI